MSVQNNPEIFEQLARQQHQEGKRCRVYIHSVPDSDWEQAHDNLRAEISVYLPEGILEELKATHQ